MQIKDIQPIIGAARAKRLGLTASRFYESHMRNHTEEAIKNVKKKDRSNLELHQWRPKKYYKTNATQLLFDCPDDITREDADLLSEAEFTQKYQKTQLPCVIRGCTKSWNVEQKWTHEAFYQNYKNANFKVGEDDDGYKLRVPYKYYLEYLVYNKDDSPLYLFDNSLDDKEQTKPIIDNYQIPKYFSDDLFKLAGQKKRPPYRWFIMGPQRSGTTVHIDPLSTSAWNASLRGHKRWVLFGSNLPKSIAKGKQFRDKNYEDQAINYFVEILPKIKQKYSRQELQIIEFIQYPGEVVFVPGGLWHAVLNLDDTIAVTQNVMTRYSFDKIWRSARTERKKFARFFLAKLKQNDINLYERAVKLNEEDRYEMENKYWKQSVSMSFTQSKSSSSYSSSSSLSPNSSQSSNKNRKRNKNMVQNKKSRSCDKIKRRQTHSQEKVSNSYLSQFKKNEIF